MFSAIARCPAPFRYASQMPHAMALRVRARQLFRAHRFGTR